MYFLMYTIWKAVQNMSSVRFVSGGIKRRILKTNRDFLGGVLKKEAYYIEGGGEERELQV